ncbi:MAG: T9SS type A sorting domain-containing protein [Bacteroidota bacterium]
MTNNILFAQDQNEWNWGSYGDSTFIPITAWLQNVNDIDIYKAAGFNTYTGFWGGITEGQIAALQAKQMHYIVGWNKTGVEDQPDLVARNHIDDPLFIAWGHRDEPDNAQPDGAGGYGPCMDPQVIKDLYNEIKAFDTTGRSVILNCGAGVARTDAYIRGECAGNIDSYIEYYKGADIASFDIYPVSSPPSPITTNNDLWYVAQGVKNMKTWTNGEKPLWFCLECTDIKGEGKPTPEQIRIEAWMGIIGGGTALQWFPFTVYPNVHNGRALIEDPMMLAAVTSVNREVRDFAPIINSRTVDYAVSRKLDFGWNIPIDYTSKIFDDTLYIFASGMRAYGSNGATFTINASMDIASEVIVIGEERKIPLTGNSFHDDFDGNEIHLYKIGGVSEDMLITGIGVKPLHLDEAFELEQNFPNPFHNETVIGFRLGESTDIELIVYNLMGQKVATLVDEVKMAGNHTVKFDASGLASGVYMYHLVAGDFVLTRKMTSY